MDGRPRFESNGGEEGELRAGLAVVLDAGGGGSLPFTEDPALPTGNNHTFGSQMPRLSLLRDHYPMPILLRDSQEELLL